MQPEPPPVEPDSALIQRSVSEPERFAEVFDRHAPTVHRYVARRMGTAAADDLTAETFLVAFRQRARYDRSHPVALPWLYGIATNLIRREQRTEIRQYRAFARTGVDPAMPSGEDDSVARVAAGAQHRRLAAALADLSERERSVLLLVAWAQLSYDEVGRELGIPIGTVRSRLHSARKRIRTAFGDFNPFTLMDEEQS